MANFDKYGGESLNWGGLKPPPLSLTPAYKFLLLYACPVSHVILNDMGKPARELAELITEVYYSPKGYAIMIHPMVPIHIWDEDEHKAITGITQASPGGDVTERIFSGEISAMRFISGRLKRLGWEAVGRWTQQQEEEGE